MSTTNIISLNQIVDLFQSFSERHYFLNDFGFGQTSEIGTSRQMDFPYMWVTLNDDSLINPQNRTAIPELSFSVLFMDKTNIQSNYLDINGVNSDNVQEVLSDMLQVLQDFVTEVQVEWGNYGIIFQDTISCYPGIDETQDKVNGWVGQFSFKLKHSNCILPTGDIVQTNLSPINPMTRYLTCDTLESCVVIQDIQNELASLTGTTSGLTCETLSGCSIIQDIQNELASLTGITSGLTCETLSGCSIIQDIQTELSNFTDVYVTGGTYNNGTSIFKNNTGGTFNVSGYYTGGTDTFVTGYTYNNNTFRIYDNSGSTFDATINTMTGLTVNGNFSATTIYGDGSNITGLPTSGGLYAQTGDGLTITATTIETTLIGGGIGTLTIPANTFIPGDSYHLNISGAMTGDTAIGNVNIRLKLKFGTTVIVSRLFQVSPSLNNGWWALDLNMTVRSIGLPTIASISTNGFFDAGNITDGYAPTDMTDISLRNINNTTFDTTISNTFNITAEWITPTVGVTKKIYSTNFVLTKTY
jgi:hypothetical protein